LVRDAVGSDDLSWSKSLLLGHLQGILLSLGPMFGNSKPRPADFRLFSANSLLIRTGNSHSQNSEARLGF